MKVYGLGDKYSTVDYLTVMDGSNGGSWRIEIIVLPS